MTCWVIVPTGQSNNSHEGRGEVGAALSDCRYFIDSLGRPANTGGNFVSLCGSSATLPGGALAGGPDYTIGRRLLAAGLKCSIINLTAGSTFYHEWYDSAEGPQLLASLATALSKLRAEYPGESDFRFIHVRNQGTSDMRVDSLEYQVGSVGGTPYKGWAAGTAIWHENLRLAIVAGGFSCPTLPLYIISSFTGLQGAVWLTSIEDQEALLAGNPRYLLKFEDALLYDDAGPASPATGAHMVPGAVASYGARGLGGGYQVVGESVADYLIRDILMGTAGTYARTVMLNHELNDAAHTPAVTHFFHLYSAGSVPISGNGYVAKSVTNDTTLWPAPSGRAVSNGIAVTFATPTGTWPDVTEVRVTDNATEGAGNLLGTDTFAPIPVSSALGPLSFGVGGLVFTVAAGGFVDAVANRMLGLVFGGTTYVANTTAHISYWAGDPQGAGAQAGTRTSMTMAAQFNTAVAGIATTAADIALAQQVTGTFVAIHTLTSGGALLYSATRPATVGTTGTIQAGQLRVTLS